MTRKQKFIVAQLAEYFQHPERCGYDSISDKCSYLTHDGKMCVAGKNFLPGIPEFDSGETIGAILRSVKGRQEKIFKTSVLYKLHTEEWGAMQKVHDALAKNTEPSRFVLPLLGFETFEQLKELCMKYPLTKKQKQ